MKKIFFVVVTVMIAVSQLSCKKEKEEDITPLFQNTVWTGEIKFDGLPMPEPFSLHFDGFGNFTMDERSGTSSGLYFTDKATRAVTVQTTRGTFKAVISNKKFSNITYTNTYLWKINSGELNDESFQVLADTKWKGVEITPPNNQKPWQLTFVTDKLFNLNEGPSNFPYTRSGVNIRVEFVDNGYFFILLPNKKIKGMYYDFFSTPGTPIYRSYDLTKQ